MKNLCALATALMLCACASSGPPRDGAADAPAKRAAASQPSERADSDVICAIEKPIGSNLPKRVCTTGAQRAAAQRDAQNTLSNLKGGARSAGAGPGSP